MTGDSILWWISLTMLKLCHIHTHQSHLYECFILQCFALLHCFHIFRTSPCREVFSSQLSLTMNSASRQQGLLMWQDEWCLFLQVWGHVGELLLWKPPSGYRSVAPSAADHPSWRCGRSSGAQYVGNATPRRQKMLYSPLHGNRLQRKEKEKGQTDFKMHLSWWTEQKTKDVMNDTFISEDKTSRHHHKCF